MLPYMGLSPRGRGNPRCANYQRNKIRSIPAWTGEPSGLFSFHSRRTVYPRVDGGTLDYTFTNEYANGLSPRGRGNR